MPDGLNNVKAIAAGNNHSLALKKDGTVIVWGYNESGQSKVPDGLNNVKAISAGDHHSLALKKDGTVIVVSNTFERSEVKADTLVLAKVEPNDHIYDSLLEAGLAVVKIGDSKNVRNVRGAVTDGANVALAIEEGARLNANNELISNLPTGIEL